MSTKPATRDTSKMSKDWSSVANNAVSRLARYLNALLPPDRREAIKSQLVKFATDRPFLASFLLAQVALSGLPVLLFWTVTITTTAFVLGVSLLVGLCGAVLFILGMVGATLLFLAPTLFVTTLIASTIWFWAVGAYFVIMWFNRKDLRDLKKPEGSFGKGVEHQNHSQEQVGSLAPTPAVQDLKSADGTVNV